MSHKLQGKLDFQGLPISIENKAGSSRHWYDSHTKEEGSTKMKYPYGYVQGTLGTDGDEVDVFVGPDETSEKVFVVTQMKGPDFSSVDEQKVMLGFSSSKAAKDAYLEHYDNPKFFGSMKELTVEEFKAKLTSHKGKLIKHLFLSLPSANIPSMAKSVHHGADSRESLKERNMTDVEKSCEHNKDVTCEKCNGTHSASDILKGLTSRMLSMTKRAVERAQTVAAAVAAAPEHSSEGVRLFGPQVAQSLHVNRPFEPPSVPVVSIATPQASASPLAPDFMTSCGGCGYTHKSLSTCPRCATNHASNREAAPIWRR